MGKFESSQPSQQDRGQLHGLMGDEERLAFYKLALVPGIGPRTISNLLEHFGSAVQVLGSSLRELGQVERIGPKLSMAIREQSTSEEPMRLIEHCEQHGVRIVLHGDADYPRHLLDLPDPPPLLFQKGSFQLEDSLSIAIVGTRHPTHYGRSVTETLSRGLVHYGFTVVSGLARGIDAIAHRTVLEQGGRTIAVLGSSLTDVYPPEHEDLANKVAGQGVLLTETSPFSQPKAGVFPQRNRLISGLSLAVIVVEAADRSGSLITAGHAADQGRDVFAVPGPINSRMSRGANRLIRDGAILIRDVDDIIEHLGPLAGVLPMTEGKAIHHPAELKLNEIETQVLQAISPTAMDIDEVIVKSGVPVARVLSTLTVLEMRGLIARISGRQVARR